MQRSHIPQTVSVLGTTRCKLPSGMPAWSCDWEAHAWQSRSKVKHRQKRCSRRYDAGTLRAQSDKGATLPMILSGKSFTKA